MKQFIDYIPLLAFFVVWAMDERAVTLFGFEHSIGGIFSASEVLLTSSILVYGSIFLLRRKLDKFQLITLCAVILFCTPTIIFRDINYLKWKAPIVNWIFSVVFLVSIYVGKKPAVQHMLDHAIELPRQAWIQLNALWIAYFLVLGGINLYVAFNFSEDIWIKFKVFGNLGLSFVFFMVQMPFFLKHMPDELETETPSQEPQDKI